MSQANARAKARFSQMFVWRAWYFEFPASNWFRASVIFLGLRISHWESGLGAKLYKVYVFTIISLSNLSGLLLLSFKDLSICAVILKERIKRNGNRLSHTSNCIFRLTRAVTLRIKLSSKNITARDVQNQYGQLETLQHNDQVQWWHIGTPC